MLENEAADYKEMQKCPGGLGWSTVPRKTTDPRTDINSSKCLQREATEQTEERFQQDHDIRSRMKLLFNNVYLF